MFCPNCGTEVSPSEKFCHSCGTALPRLEEQATTVINGLDETVVQGAAPTTVTTPASPEADEPWAQPMEAPATTPAPEVQPTMVQQPVQTQPPYEPQPAPAPESQPAPAPAPEPAPEPQPWYMSVPARIALGVVGVAMIVIGVLRLTGVLNKKPTNETKPAVTQTTSSTVGPTDVVPDPTSTSSADTSSTGTSSTGGGFTPTETPKPDETPKPTDTGSDTGQDSNSGTDYTQGRSTSFLSDANIADTYGNPTVYAFSELEGWQMCTLAQKNGFEYVEVDNVKGWNAEETFWFYFGSTGILSDKEISTLGKGGGNDAIVFGCVTSDYADEKSTYQGLAKCSTLCSATAPSGEYLAVCYGPSMKEYLVNVYDMEDGDYEMDIYTPEAIANGLFDAINEGTYGSTAEEVFQNYTGKTTDTHE